MAAHTAPRSFRTPADFRRWLEANHARRSELRVAFPKKGSGKKGIGYLEALDEALCFGAAGRRIALLAPPPTRGR